MLVFGRHFVRENGKNKISFKYKVDGAACRRGSIICASGLYFYIDGVLKLKRDLQFQWKEFSSYLSPVSSFFVWVIEIIWVIFKFFSASGLVCSSVNFRNYLSFFRALTNLSSYIIEAVEMSQY